MAVKKLKKYLIHLFIVFLKFCAAACYRIRILVKGPVGQRELEDLLERDLSFRHRGWWDLAGWRHLFMKELYKREYVSFICAHDGWLTSRLDDPFTNNKDIVNKKYEAEFNEISARNTYLPGGMVPTELFLVYCMTRALKPEVFIESGVKYGYSTIFIAEAIKKNREEGYKGRLSSLSLFESGEREFVQKRLKSYIDFADLYEGFSEENIDKLIAEHRNAKVAMLIDGPKASSKGWDILTKKVIDGFPNISFLLFDSCQDHVPYWGYDSSAMDYTIRGINIERLKVNRFYKKCLQPKDIKLAFQSNEFCRRYNHLNEAAYKRRNDQWQTWGRGFKWAPYKIDRIDNHIAYTYKLGVIYRGDLLASCLQTDKKV